MLVLLMKTKNFIPFSYRNRRGKYNARSCEADGHRFDSMKERDYYLILKDDKRLGRILSFERQVSFDLFALEDVKNPDGWGDVRVCSHIVDFLVTLPNGDIEVREVKGFATAVWDLKRKLFEANYPDIPYKVVR